MPASWLRAFLLLFLLALFVALIQFNVIAVAFEKLNLSRESAYLLFLSALFGSLINLPLFSISAKSPLRRDTVGEDMAGLFDLPPVRRAARVTVAVNVGGCVIPVAFSAYLLANGALAATEVLIAIAMVAMVSHFSSRPLRGIGVVMPLLVAPVTAALVATALDFGQRAPLAYVAGTLGVLLGADLFRLKDIRSLGAPAASIGGAGTFDGVFISGLVAVLLA